MKAPNQRILTLVSVFAVTTGTLGCNDGEGDDKGPVVLSPQQARDLLESTFHDTNDCARQLRDGAAAQALFDFLDLRDGDVGSESWIDLLGEGLEDTLDLSYVEDERRLDFPRHTGTYGWEPASSSWSRSSAPSDAVVFRFPSRQSATSNNASATLSTYRDDVAYIDGDLYRLPVALGLSVLVDAVTLADLAANVSYDNGNFPMPVDGDADLRLAPFDADLNLHRVDRTTFQVQASLTGPSACTVTGSAEVFLLHDDYESLEGPSDVDRVTATFTFLNAITLEVIADVDTLDGLNDPTTTQINALVKATLSHGGAKIAELVFETVHDGYKEDERLMVVFSDGSKDDIVDHYLEPFVDQIEQDYRPYFGAWSETDDAAPAGNASE